MQVKIGDVIAFHEKCNEGTWTIDVRTNSDIVRAETLIASGRWRVVPPEEQKEKEREEEKS